MSTNKHPEFKLPDDPHAKHRYESAMKHVESAKAAGKSSAELHAIFKKVMEFNPSDIDSIPKDDAHKNYREAAIAAKEAKNPEEAHAIFKKTLGR